jgi:hypothetical protein
MTQMSNSEAYRILTRELTNMHHTERTALDRSASYQRILNAVKMGKNGLAVAMSYNRFRNGQGDAWRAKQGLPFTANAE